MCSLNVCMHVLYICVCVCVFEPLTVGAVFVFWVCENKLISKRTFSQGFHSYIVVITTE